MIFRGTFEHALDAKHRLTVPSKFRAALAGGVVLAASPETTASAPSSIAMWTAEAYEAYTAAALPGLSPISPEARDLKRFFFNYSHDTELDSANRVMIPPSLMEYAGLDKDVVVRLGRVPRGVRSLKYTGYSEDVLIRVPDIAAKLATLLDMTQTHIPVLAGELIDVLDPHPGETAVDCTFGGGGHARLIADRLVRREP